MGNLNTHSLASLYNVFEPDAALRLFRYFEIHYTSKHGSWLDMAELEIGVTSCQCLGLRIAAIEKMRDEVQSCATQRNSQKTTVHRQFKKLRHLYPKF